MNQVYERKSLGKYGSWADLYYVHTRKRCLKRWQKCKTVLHRRIDVYNKNNKNHCVRAMFVLKQKSSKEDMMNDSVPDMEEAWPCNCHHTRSLSHERWGLNKEFNLNTIVLCLYLHGTVTVRSYLVHDVLYLPCAVHSIISAILYC
jgi:hypothetical protein